MLAIGTQQRKLCICVFKFIDIFFLLIFIYEIKNLDSLQNINFGNKTLIIDYYAIC